MDKVIASCIPTLQSIDASKSFDFYRSIFGFTKDWEHRYEPGFPLFISMSCGNTTIFITEHKNESAFGAELYLYVTDIVKLESHVKGLGVKFEVELHETSYGTREFNIRDLDGNKLRIGQDL